MSALRLLYAARKRSGFPTVDVVNCLVERDPTSETEPVTLIARPGTENFAQVGTAPIRAMFQKSGLFDDNALIPANDTLHRIGAGGATSAFTGTIAGDDLVIIEGGFDTDQASIARLATGEGMYLVSGTSVAREVFPAADNDVGATSIAYLGGYWIGTAVGTDDAYFLATGETAWSPIEYAAAEYAPDKLAGVVVAGEIAWLLGRATLEGWRLTGSADPPLAPVGGLKFDVGCASIYAAVNCRGTLVFVDNDGIVRSTDGGQPRALSDNALAEQIRRVASADLRASFFVKDGHPVYSLTLGTTATWLYDMSSETWTRANTQGDDFWRADLFCNIDDIVLARDATSNQIYRLDPDLGTDAGETFTMEFPAFLETKERPVAVANVELHCEKGGAPSTGQGSDPVAEMRVSRDGGKTWGPPKRKGLGILGDYLKRVRWFGSWTAFHPHGLWFKWRIADPTVRRISGASINTP